MLCLFDTGTISLKGNGLTWDIHNFFSLSLDVGSEIRSTEFQYADARYTLALWPRGLKGVDKEWFGVCLYSSGACKQRGSIQLSIVTGGRVFKSCTIQCSENGIYKDDRFMEWSDFNVLRKKIAPNGCLTIVCSLFCERDSCLEDYELEDSIASVKDEYGIECLPSQISFNSGDYTFATSSCMIPSSSINSASGKRKTPLAPDVKSRAPSVTTHSTFSASASDALDKLSYAFVATAESNSPGSCVTVATAALECNRSSKNERKRSAATIADADDKMPNDHNGSDLLRTPELNSESQSANDSPQEGSTSYSASASKPNIVSTEKTAPCQACANPTSQSPHQSVNRVGLEFSSADCSRNFKSLASVWNEFTASSVRKSETNISGSSISNEPRMSDTRVTPTSGIASEEGRIPAHVLYSSAGNADPQHFGKAFTAEVNNHKGPLSKNSFEYRNFNPPLTFVRTEKLSKLRNNCTSSSALDAVPTAKRHSEAIESDGGPVLQFKFPNSTLGVSPFPPAVHAESSDPESNITASPVAHNASQKGSATAAEADASDFDVASTNGADHVSDPAVSSSDDAPGCLAREAEFHRKLQSLEKLSEVLGRLYLRSEGCDLTIKIKDHEFRAHRFFLIGRSPVLAEMLSNSEGGTLEIPEGACDPCKFHDFLLFVYDGKVDGVTDANVCSMYRAAQFFRFPELSAQCVEFMRNSLSVRAVCDVLSVAMQHNESELLELATVFFAKNLKAILKSDEWIQFGKKNFELANELYAKALDICYTKTSA